MTARNAPTCDAFNSFTQIATVRIDLKDSDPPIWRVVEVPTSVTLKVLHDIIQVTMGWFDYHLWEMVIGDQTYGNLTPDKTRKIIRDLMIEVGAQKG